METILFFDDWSLQRRDNLDRHLGQPKWVPEATLPDDVTEGTWNFPCVWYDQESKLWKAVYGGTAPFEPKRPRRGSQRPKTQILLYAESHDGVHWEVPDLSDRVDLPVRWRPNQVYGVTERLDGCPTYDPHESDPNKRLKYVFCQGEGPDAVQGLATSGNGIDWTVQHTSPRDGTMDGPTPVYYNPYSDRYVISTRRYIVDRRIALVETSDFRTYSKPRLVLGPDPEDPPLTEFYGMPIKPYEGMFLGLLWRFQTDPSEFGAFKRYGPIDCVLAYSYDGDHFQRAYHHPFIPRNDLGDHGGGGIYVTSMVVDQDNVIRFYSSGSKAEHFRNDELEDAALMLHTLRLDGFMYLQSKAVLGTLTTKAVIFRSPVLQLNVQCPYGSTRVQILDESLTPIEGLTFEDSIPFTGDDLFYQPKWKSGRDLSAVLDQKVYLEIELTEAKLYAIRGEFVRSARWKSTP